MSNRPHPLALLTCVLIVLAGCSAAPAEPATESEPSTASPSSSSNSTTDVELDFEAFAFDFGRGEPIEGGIFYSGCCTVPERRYLTVVDSPEEAGRFNLDDLSDRESAFINDTDFDTSYLVVYQQPSNKREDTTVKSVRQTNRTLTIRVHYNADVQGDSSGPSVEMVVVRLHGNAPERVVYENQFNNTIHWTDEQRTVTTRPSAKTPSSTFLHPIIPW